jgi:hypothetical protein
MMLFLLVLLVAIGLGIAGAIVKSLLFLLIIGIVLLVADLVWAGYRGRRNRWRGISRA